MKTGIEKDAKESKDLHPQIQYSAKWNYHQKENVLPLERSITLETREMCGRRATGLKTFLDGYGHSN